MKARPFILVGLVVVLSTGITWKFLHPSEPVYQGRKFSEWISRLNYGPDATNAAIAVRKIGSNAVPALLKMAEAKDSAFKVKMAKLVEKQSVFKLSFRRAFEDRSLAHAGFLALRSEAKSAIPRLSELTESSDEEVAILAVQCLAIIGSNSLPALTKSLTNLNSRVQGSAAMAIGEFGSAAKPAIPALLRTINPTNQDNGAIRTLGEIGDDSLIPLFSQLLLNTNTAADAGFALGRRGANAIAPLTLALTNSNKIIRAAASAGLDPDVRETGPGRKRLDDEYSFARICCVYNLKMMQASFRMYAGNSRSLTSTPPPTPMEEFSPVIPISTPTNSSKKVLRSYKPTNSFE